MESIDGVIDATHVCIANRTYLHFTGNNYLGLAHVAPIKQNAIAAIERWGTNLAASRITTGTTHLHQRLEKKLALFKGQSDAVCFASGFLSNAILLEMLAQDYQLVAIDEWAHPSILWAIGKRLPMVRYAHCQPEALYQILSKESRRVLVMTDGVFPITGEIAPLDCFMDGIDRYGIALVVDDAHATGVLGENGRGTPEHFNIVSDNIYQSETMSKALGAYGGFISGNQKFIAQLRHVSQIYMGSTALSPACVGAAISALDYLDSHAHLRRKLIDNVSYLKKMLNGLGLAVDATPVPIIPLVFPDVAQAGRVATRLAQQGIFVCLSHYPGGGDQPTIRLTVNANHTLSDMDRLVNLLETS